MKAVIGLTKKMRVVLLDTIHYSVLDRWYKETNILSGIKTEMQGEVEIGGIKVPVLFKNVTLTPPEVVTEVHYNHTYYSIINKELSVCVEKESGEEIVPKRLKRRSKSFSLEISRADTITVTDPKESKECCEEQEQERQQEQELPENIFDSKKKLPIHDPAREKIKHVIVKALGLREMFTKFVEESVVLCNEPKRCKDILVDNFIRMGFDQNVVESYCKLNKIKYEVKDHELCVDETLSLVVNEFREFVKKVRADFSEKYNNHDEKQITIDEPINVCSGMFIDINQRPPEHQKTFVRKFVETLSLSYVLVNHKKSDYRENYPEFFNMCRDFVSYYSNEEFGCFELLFEIEEKEYDHGLTVFDCVVPTNFDNRPSEWNKSIRFLEASNVKTISATRHLKNEITNWNAKSAAKYWDELTLKCKETICTVCWELCQNNEEDNMNIFCCVCKTIVCFQCHIKITRCPICREKNTMCKLIDKNSMVPESNFYTLQQYLSWHNTNSEHNIFTIQPLPGHHDTCDKCAHIDFTTRKEPKLYGKKVEISPKKFCDLMYLLNKRDVQDIIIVDSSEVHKLLHLNIMSGSESESESEYANKQHTGVYLYDL